MGQLDAFTPRLIGSVASANIHGHCAIQLFTDQHGLLEQSLRHPGHPIDRVERQVVKGGQVGDHVLYHFEQDTAPMELSVYTPGGIFITPRSSIDGMPIDRLTCRRVEASLVA